MTSIKKKVVRPVLELIYLCLPHWAKRKMEYAYSFFPYANTFWKYKRALEKSQWYTPHQLEQLQLKKLNILLKYVYEDVPYYRKIFQSRLLKPEDITAVEDLKKLPILTKEDVRNNFEDLKSKYFKKYNPIFNHTSGSTGEPLKFYTSKERYDIAGAFICRHRNWTGWDILDRRAAIEYLPQEVRESEVASNLDRWRLDRKETLELCIFHMKEEELKKCIKELEQFRPKLIKSSPSILFVLAQYIITRKINSLQPQAIITGSEILFLSQRRVIEEAFKCKVYDWYGSNELVAMIQECPMGGLHINSEYGIIELVNSKGENVLPGRKGFIVATQFDNFAMPLIRYKIGDVARLSSRTCICGRGLPIIESIEGRIEELIITRNERIIGRLDVGFGLIRRIKLWQIVQDKKGHILVKIVKNNDYSEEDQKRLLANLQIELDNEMDIDFEFVQDIPWTKRGKFQTIISKVPIEL